MCTPISLSWRTILISKWCTFTSLFIHLVSTSFRIVIWKGTYCCDFSSRRLVVPSAFWFVIHWMCDLQKVCCLIKSTMTIMFLTHILSLALCALFYFCTHDLFFDFIFPFRKLNVMELIVYEKWKTSFCSIFRRYWHMLEVYFSNLFTKYICVSPWT